MRTLYATALTLILAGAAAGAALAEDPVRLGSAHAGRVFAGYNCDACHVIAANQDIRPLVTGYAPSFAEIANRPDTTPAALRAFLSRPHGYSNMPYPDLRSTDVADLVAYIMSLRHRHDGREEH